MLVIYVYICIPNNMDVIITILQIIEHELIAAASPTSPLHFSVKAIEIAETGAKIINDNT